MYAFVDMYACTCVITPLCGSGRRTRTCTTSHRSASNRVLLGLSDAMRRAVSEQPSTSFLSSSPSSCTQLKTAKRSGVSHAHPTCISTWGLCGLFLWATVNVPNCYGLHPIRRHLILPRKINDMRPLFNLMGEAMPFQ